MLPRCWNNDKGSLRPRMPLIRRSEPEFIRSGCHHPLSGCDVLALSHERPLFCVVDVVVLSAPNRNWMIEVFINGLASAAAERTWTGDVIDAARRNRSNRSARRVINTLVYARKRGGETEWERIWPTLTRRRGRSGCVKKRRRVCQCANRFAEYAPVPVRELGERRRRVCRTT